MSVPVPDIAESEQTPLVQRLLEIIHQQAELLQQLRDEIAILKGLKPKPKIAPSPLEAPPSAQPAPPEASNQKRPGSAKRAKTAQLTIHEEVIVKPQQLPPGSLFKGYEDFVVQEIILKPHNVRYRRERWVTPDGVTVVAGLPDTVVSGSHFGPDLLCFILHQYHHQHVTQPLLLEQLREFGIDISAGQINNILTENKDGFHQEKAEILQAGLQTASYVGVDDTTARHDGHNGYCTAIGNDLFAYFESTDSKSRLNFLTVLRAVSPGYAINEVALGYWQRQQLPQGLRAALQAGPRQFADCAAWQAHLRALAITAERHVLIATEGALLGQIIEQGAAADLVILSDGAPQFDILVHASCWVHAERPLARMIPYNETHRAEIERLRDQIWELYKDLKGYRDKPDAAVKASLEARFDALVEQKTNYPSSIGGVLKEMRGHKADLLRVLERPEVPLHNNGSESIIRGYVKTRKISGSTRSDAGRRCRDTFASLKKTCGKLRMSFWAYLCDRLRGLGQIPRLAEVIRQQAQEMTADKALAASPEAVRGGAAG